MANIISLFDGISCGMLALQRAGIPVDRYYASEIDKHAIKVGRANHGDKITQLGDVTRWHAWKREAGIDYSGIDLLLAGSPCQGFSFAGRQLNFNDPRSALFFEFVAILNHVRRFNPNVKFLLENVMMKQEYIDVISDLLDVEPIKINSSLVSAQNRVRLYWTNIEGVEQPEDKGLMLMAMLNPHSTTEDLRLSEKAIEYMNRQVKGGRTHWQFNHHSDTKNTKSAAVVANFFKGVPYNVLVDCDIIRHFAPVECERLQTLPDNYTDSISKTQRFKAIGNGWTVDVVAHILRNIRRNKNHG